jgi:hypothetical protein
MRSADSSLTEDESDSLSGICEEVVMADVPKYVADAVVEG